MITPSALLEIRGAAFGFRATREIVVSRNMHGSCLDGKHGVIVQGRVPAVSGSSLAEARYYSKQVQHQHEPRRPCAFRKPGLNRLRGDRVKERSSNSDEY
jgi:hypothetical protein